MMLKVTVLRTFVVTGLITCIFIGEDAAGELLSPRYISHWVWMDTHNSSTTEHVFKHGFGENPFKAEVQVWMKGDNFTYPGIKSSNVIQRGQDWFRAGVMCVYNSTHVRVLGPPKRGQTEGYLIYTGDTGEWYGGENGFPKTTEAKVRVRVWHKDDFPSPRYVSPNITLKKSQHHHKTEHGVSDTESAWYITVQLLFQDGWIAEAQGSESNYAEHRPLRWGGVVYAVSNKHIQVWAPHGNPNGIIYTYYGWGNCNNISLCSYSRATVQIRLWSLVIYRDMYSSFGVHQTTHSVGKRSTTHRYAFNPPFDADTDLISVTAHGSQNNGENYVFSGAGTAMMHKSGQTGGVVYAYNNHTQTVRMWHPKIGRIVTVDTSSGHTGFALTTATITVCIFRGRKQLTTTTEQITTKTSIPKGTTTTTADTTTSAVAKGASTSTATTKAASTVSAVTQTSKQLLTTTTTTTTIGRTSTLAATNTPTADKASSPVTTNIDNKTSPLTSHGNLTASTTYRVRLTRTTNVAMNCTNHVTAFLALGTYDIDLSELGKNVLIDFSYIDNKYILFTCKMGYISASGEFNRTFNVGNKTLSGQTPVCKEKNSLRSNIEIELRTKEIVRNLTVAANTTAKYRRSLNSAMDLRQSSRAIGMISGFLIGGFVALIVLSDMLRFFRFICSRYRAH